MSEPFSLIRAIITRRGEAIRWACILEATAPKPGNVFPGRPFSDLCYRDFVEAAESAAALLELPGTPWSERVLRSVRDGRARSGTNVNLGIALLLGPLVAADEALSGDAGEGQIRQDGPSGGPRATADRPAGGEADEVRPTVGRSLALGLLERENWGSAVGRQLDAVSPGDSQRLFEAIALSGAGGLGRVDSMDVHDPDAEHDDILAAMRLAAPRDRIARQYSDRFRDLFEHIVPVVERAVLRWGDLLTGIVRAQVELLASEPDSLIARKYGAAVAEEVQRRAAATDPTDSAEVERLDRWLRGGGRRFNPGTTADLIAAALYVILRTPPTLSKQ
jgi:triphosphoribosyl-dephospho-CoA synthase